MKPSVSRVLHGLKGKPRWAELKPVFKRLSASDYDWISNITFRRSSSAGISSPLAILMNEQRDGFSWFVSKRWTCLKVRSALSDKASCVSPCLLRSDLMTLEIALRILSSGTKWISAFGIESFYEETQFTITTTSSYYEGVWIINIATSSTRSEISA